MCVSVPRIKRNTFRFGFYYPFKVILEYGDISKVIRLCHKFNYDTAELVFCTLILFREV